MSAITSVREFHSQLDQVCSSLESLFRLAGPDYEDLDTAAAPALLRFRELLDLGDSLVGPDPD